MRLLFNKYPVDIIICIITSVLFLPIILLNLTGLIRIILGLPFILLIPGYLTTYALLPTKKTEEGIDFIERILLSIGFSLAIVALIGIGLYFISGDIQIESAFTSIFVYVICTGIIGIYRWFNTYPSDRFIISLNVSIPKSENKKDKILTVILVISIIFATVTLIYMILTPKNMEQSTEFYILNSSGKAADYLRNLNAEENASLIIGLINHEYQTIDYTIEIWLINQTNIYNEKTMENETIINNMWFMDKINVMLEHVNSDTSWEPQWEYNYTFNVKKTGENLKLAFLLFKTPTDNYDYNKDYKQLSEQKISSAYGENHIWINVN